jgi:squalene-hopene/tetraprenyl-beta-curcumene cyclase
MISKRRAPREDAVSLDEAIEYAQEYLLAQQHPEGYWLGELEADVSVTAGYIPLMHFMRGEVDPARRRKVITFVLSKQRPDGSWSSYHGGPGDVNVSVQAYFALKLAGIPADEPRLERARRFILSQGGIARTGVFTKIWLALFGQVEWQDLPTIPPELILLPNWSPFNLYAFASWSRATIVALMVVLSRKPVCNVPASAQVDELWLEPNQHSPAPGKVDKLFSWENFFWQADKLFKLWQRSPWKPGRAAALRLAERWITSHQEADGSWAGIMLPWIYSLFALKSLGYALDHPAIAHGLAGLEDFILEDDTTLRLQPAMSPVWDTAWAVLALRESGLGADHPALQRAGSWLLKQEIRHSGDWQVKNPRLEPGGWAFEFYNNCYPDLDDTPLVARALASVQLSEKDERKKAAAIRRALHWVLGMQSKDGGWAAFDRDNDQEALAHVPFADFMSPLDPTCADVTAHVVEFLGEQGVPLEGALNYLKRTQGRDGAWYGRWGVNYLYGTGLALSSLAAAGEASRQAYIARAAAWLTARQNADGGFGETCRSYDNPTRRGSGPSTASQTAWALLGLLAAEQSEAAEKGISYLLRSQQPDGNWEEEAYTGTGFPRAFYLRYDLYRSYFPLLALARYRKFASG